MDLDYPMSAHTILGKGPTERVEIMESERSKLLLPRAGKILRRMQDE